MSHYISHAQILDAVIRCNEEGASVDGTYRLIPSWVGSVRVWMAERIVETSGYEVAYAEVLGMNNDDLDLIEQHTRIGVWFDDETGEFCLDHTMHIRGTRAGVALDVARLYSQKAVWSWHDELVIETTEPATAL